MQYPVNTLFSGLQLPAVGFDSNRKPTDFLKASILMRYGKKNILFFFKQSIKIKQKIRGIKLINELCEKTSVHITQQFQ